ncbi:Golgi complex component 7-domain-containing protein [Gautieria morchelliformis]|nr:Golgi complex component 7-domain-containing protein [Gautieria morchelliformis]
MAEVQGLPSSSDLLASLEEHTDIADWINELLDSSATKNASDTRGAPDVTELATRLEVACQDTSSQLEQSIDDISRTVPRLTYDLQFLRESTLTLKLALSSLQSRLSSSLGDHETTQALDRLAYLDTVKNHMEASRDVLREAESWSTLESEVTALIAELQYEKAAERLAEASKSMVVFQNTAEFETRRALMVSLQNQLEASLSSALVAATNARDVSSCKSYYGIFANIQREAEFRNYYNGSRRTAVIQLWTTATLLDVDGEPPPPESSPIKFSDFLQRFFADLVTLVNEERTYVPEIFPDPQQTLSTFVQSTIDALTPSLSQRLSGVSEHYGALALPELIKAFRVAEEFAVATDKVLEKVGYAALFSPQTLAPHADDFTKSHSRRLSKRMSMSRRLGPTRSNSSISGNVFAGSGGAWEQALFEPFVDLQAEYESLEKKHLEYGLRAVQESSQFAHRAGDYDGGRAFREHSVDVFSLAEESLSRCVDFTHGYGAVGLLHSLDYIFSSFLEWFQKELLSSTGSTVTSTSANIPSDAFEELDYTAENWGAIQLALHLLEACRVVRDRLSVLELKVRAGLVQVASSFRLARSDSQGLYISNTTRGEALLLSQSTLNSAELHTLLDGLEPSAGSVSGTPPPEQPPSLLNGAKNATIEFTKACQSVLRDTLLSPLFQHLSAYPSYSGWSADNKRDAGTELRIPTFSLSPTPTIQRVAEGLLNLPRLFEVYADDDALAFSIETLPFVDAESLHAVLNPSPAPSPVGDHHLRRLSSSHSFNPPLPPPQQTLPPEMVVSAWLSSLTLSLLSHFTAQVLPSIHSLTRPGAAQLASDIGYLSNVVRALNVEWGELERWKEVVELDDEAGKARVKEGGLGDEEVFSTVARLRGWT